MNPDTNSVASSATTSSAKPAPVAATAVQPTAGQPVAKPNKGFGKKPKFQANAPKA